MVIASHCLNQLPKFDECTGAVTKCLHVAWVKGQHLVKTPQAGRKLFEFAHGKPKVVIGVIAVWIEFDCFAQEIYCAVQQSEFGINDSQHFEGIAMPRVNGKDLPLNGFGLRQLIACQARSGSIKLNFHQLSTSFWYRNVFMLGMSIFDSVVLLVFPEEIFRAFNFHEGATDMVRYLWMVGWFGVLVTVLYGYSYLKDWEFERVSLICFSVMLTNLGQTFSISTASTSRSRPT